MTLKEKYPNEYFVHWISMLTATECPLTADGFQQQCAAYIEFESEAEFRALQEELKLIVQDEADLADFVLIAEHFQLPMFTVPKMKQMIAIILAE